jgi:type IV secretion system protein VirB1
MDANTFLALALACAPAVHPGTATALVAVESGFNPHAIGVVGGTLLRQPRTRAEAVATANSLEAAGWIYSVGLAQINSRNFARLGLSRTSAFDPCTNLRAMQVVLGECMVRTRGPPQIAVRQALSCYYSGDPESGFRDGYVARLLAAARIRSDEVASASRDVNYRGIP